MTKIKLTDGTIINASNVEVVNGVLKITTNEYSVEELAEIFKDKSKTNLITLMTESEKESGYKTGFTSFAGINYDADGNKTVELFQPKDLTEARIANAEATANMAKEAANSIQETTSSVNSKVTELEEMTANTNEKVSSIETDITDIQLAIVEIYESSAGGIE